MLIAAATMALALVAAPAVAGPGRVVTGGPASSASDLLLNPATGRTLAIEAVVGSGASSAYLVVDFEPTGGHTYAWQYNFDGSATSFDMLAAVTDATALEVDLGFFDGFGNFVIDFQYPTFSEDGQDSNFWAFSLGSPVGASGGTVDWSFASEGIDFRDLSDGDVDGWYNGFEPQFPSSDPRVPVIPEPAAALCVLGGAALSVCSRQRRSA